MIGGNGDDIYYVNQAGETVIELFNEGTDTVSSTVSHTLAVNVENLTLGGAGSIANLNGVGNDQDNDITGTDASNTLSGGNGNDTLHELLGVNKLVGGLGDDTYVFVGGTDIITEALNAGTDTVNLNVAFAGVYTLGVNLENLSVIHSAGGVFFGNELNNVINGGNANKTINGGLGQDTIRGGDGQDTLFGGEGNDQIFASGQLSFNHDTVYGVLGNDTIYADSNAHTLYGEAGNDTYSLFNYFYTADILELFNEGIDTVLTYDNFYALGANLENLTLRNEPGNSAVIGTGNELNNVITGNAQNNILSGLVGNDTLYGSSGTDMLNGGDGNDRLVGGPDHDTLTGGLGVDRYRYSNTFEVGFWGSDTITDFAITDFFEFAGGAFGGLAIGTLLAANFQSRTADNFAVDSDDRFVYRQNDGTLWFDDNGGDGTAAGASNAIMIADITDNFVLLAGDILIY